MNIIGLFLYGEDEVDNVRTLRNDAMTAALTGRIVEWTSTNVSTKKVDGIPLDVLIEEANYFLRLYDDGVRAVNPVITDTVASLLFS